MAIVQTINVSQFTLAFYNANRADNFSLEGLQVLFDYLENLSNETGEPIEIDVIALCCEYNEESVTDIISSYDIDVSDANGDEDEVKALVREYLEEHTSVCGEVDGGFVYAAF